MKEEHRTGARGCRGREKKFTTEGTEFCTEFHGGRRGEEGLAQGHRGRKKNLPRTDTNHHEQWGKRAGGKMKEGHRTGARGHGGREKNLPRTDTNHHEQWGKRARGDIN